MPVVNKIKLPDNTTVDINDARDVEVLTNKVIALSSSSTDVQYPSAKCVYDALQNAGGGSEINNVTVTVDANVGTPSGSATYNSGTLAFTFNNLKGATGANGASGLKYRTTYTSSDTSVSNLAWDTVHVFPEMSSLTLTLASFPSDGYNHEMLIEFTSGATATTLSAISGVTWAYGLTLPTMVETNSKYQISIDGSMVACYIQSAVASS